MSSVKKLSFKKISAREKILLIVSAVLLIILVLVFINSYKRGVISPLAATTQTFADVLPTYWAYNQIEAIYAAGLTGGCSSNPLKYCPEDSVTREQMSAFLAKAYYYPGTVPNPLHHGSYYFTDVPAGSTFDKYIGNIKELGITQGCTATTYCPAQAVTREQMAVFLTRTFKLDTSTFDPANFQTEVISFSDVPVSYGSWKEIQTVYLYGITQGCTDEQYCPTSNVTRAQMAVFLSSAVLNQRADGNVNISHRVCTSSTNSTSPCIPASNAVIQVDKISSEGDLIPYFRTWANSQGLVQLKGLQNSTSYVFTASLPNVSTNHCDYGYLSTPVLSAGSYSYTYAIYPQVTFYQGKVKDAQTDFPINEARVKIYDMNGTLLTAFVTDNDGNYNSIGTFESAPKTHQIVVESPEYARKQINLSSAVCTTNTLDIALDRLDY